MGWLRAPFRLDNGESLQNRSPKENDLEGLSAVAFAVDGQHAVFGFSDGKIRLGRIGFNTRFVEPSEVPAAIRQLSPGAISAWDEGLVTRTPTGQFLPPEIDGSKLEPAIAGIDKQPIAGW